MVSKILKIASFGILLLSFNACNAQSSGCCSSKVSTTSCSPSCSSSKKTSMVNQSQTCKKCGKTSCDRNCTAQSTAQANLEGTKLKALVPSCSLSEAQMVQRKAELTDKNSLFRKVGKIVELQDGYDFVFYESKEFSNDLLAFINFERNCCSNFSFALEFEPNNKATHLKIYGSQAIKTELKKGFTELGVISKL